MTNKAQGAKKPVPNPPLNGLQLWLDAQDFGTVTLGAGDVVTAWADKSGKGVDVSQGTDANRPIFRTAGISGSNDNVVIEWDGSNDLLEAANFGNGSDFLTNEFTVVSVGFTLGGDQREVLTITGGNVNLQVKLNTSFECLYIGANLLADTSTGGTMSTETLEVLAIRRDSTEQINRINGVQTGVDAALAANANDQTSLNLDIGAAGAIRVWDGPLGEILVWNRALTDFELEREEQRLADKWGLDRPPLNGLQLWLDAQDQSTITKTVSDEVTTWADKSAKGIDVTQAVTAEKPIFREFGISGSNGKPVIEFDGSNDRLVGAGFGATNDFNTNEFTFLVVAFNTDDSALKQMCIVRDLGGDPDENTQMVINLTVAQVFYQDPGAVSDLASGGSPSLTTLELYTGIRDSSDQILRINSIQVAIDAALGAGALTSASFPISVGDSATETRPWDGPIGELIIWNRALTAAELATQEARLIKKWKI